MSIMVNRDDEDTGNSLTEQLNIANGKIKDLEYEVSKLIHMVSVKNKEIEDVTTVTNSISLDVYNSTKLKYEIAVAKLKKLGAWCGE